MKHGNYAGKKAPVSQKQRGLTVTVCGQNTRCSRVNEPSKYRRSYEVHSQNYRLLLRRKWQKGILKICKISKEWQQRGRAIEEKWHLHADGASKAEVLNDQFSATFTKESPVYIPDPIGRKFPSIKNIEISVGGIAKILWNIKPNKASDPDHIPCRILKELADEIAPFPATIFQQSLDCGHLPEDWKIGQISPAFKKGDKCQAVNYQPISLTCVCCKIMEHIICHHVHAHLDDYNILSHLQHGFRTRDSCESQLITTLHDLLPHYDNKSQADIAVLDFSVRHRTTQALDDETRALRREWQGRCLDCWFPPKQVTSGSGRRSIIMSTSKIGGTPRHHPWSAAIPLIHQWPSCICDITSPPSRRQLSVIPHHKIRIRPEDTTTRPKAGGSLCFYLGVVVQSIKVCHYGHHQSGKKEAA